MAKTHIKEPSPETGLYDRSKQLLELINQSPELAELSIKTLFANLTKKRQPNLKKLTDVFLT